MAPPFGDKGLKVDDAREVVRLTQMPPVGTEKGAIMVGPLDDAQPEAADALLKTIEELNTNLFVLGLWARDLQDVLPTIQSRCQHEWSPGTAAAADEELYGKARDLLQYSRKKDYASLMEVLGEIDNDKVEEVLRLIPDVLVQEVRSGKKADLSPWRKIRELLVHKYLKVLDVVAVLCEEPAP